MLRTWTLLSPSRLCFHEHVQEVRCPVTKKEEKNKKHQDDLLKLRAQILSSVELCVHAKVLQAHDTSFNGKIDISFRGSVVAHKYSRMNTSYLQTVTVAAGGIAASFTYFKWYLTTLTQQPTGNCYTAYKESSFIRTPHQKTTLPHRIVARLLQIQVSWTSFLAVACLWQQKITYLLATYGRWCILIMKLTEETQKSTVYKFPREHTMKAYKEQLLICLYNDYWLYGN